MNKKSLFSKAGFTLIEILVVVAIIGILAGVVLVGLRGTGPQARDSRRAADLKQVQNGLELYYNKCGYYPGPANCAGNAWGSAPTSWAALRTVLTDTTLDLGIRNIPQDPQDPEGYFYASADGDSYVLGATFEQTDSRLFDGDIDDTAEGVDCDDPIYCIAL